MKHFSIILPALLCLFLTSFSGCSDGRLKTELVNGVITLDGEPLADAAVYFKPKVQGQGAAGFGRTNEKGEYILQTINGHPDAGTLPGEYAVTVEKYKSVPTGKKVADGYGGFTEEMNSVILFPEMTKYTDVKTTPLSATVVKGENKFDFEVKSK